MREPSTKLGEGAPGRRLVGADRDRLIEELRQAQERTRADLEAMTRLHRLGSLFVREGNLEPVLAEIVDAAIAISGADFGTIQLLEAESSDLRIVAQRGFPDWWLEFWNSVSRGHGVCGTALERGARVVVEDVEHSPIFVGTPALEIQRRAGVRAVQSTPLVSRSGKPLGMFSTHWRKAGRPDERTLRLLDLLSRHAADILERAQNEEALRRSELKHRALVANAVIGFALATPEGRILEANPAYCAITGYGIDELRKTTFGRLIAAEDRAENLRCVDRMLAGEISDFVVENRYRRKDGTVTWVRKSTSLIRDASGEPEWIVALMEDITERKQAEMALQATLRRFYDVLSSMYSAVLLVANEGRIEFANPALCKLLHLKESPDELVGLNAVEMLARFKGAYLRPDEEAAHAVEILRRGEPVKGEEIAMADGRTCLRDFVPLSVNGAPCGRLWLHFDITDRKCAEEALREEDRRKAEFLGVLSHELRNPLAPIRNSIYLLERSAPGTDQATHAREVIRRQAEQLTRLVDDLLDVTRISRGKIVLQRTRVDLRDIVRKTTDDLRSLFAHADVSLHVDSDFGPVWIAVDAARLTQVLGNLLQNAVKFTPAGGSVTVIAAARGDQAELCVRDDGIGMEPGTIQHMFEPFAQAETALARTKGGLGLGLPLVKGLVELHGGAVEARSGGIGHGSEFLVRLPLAEIRAEAPREHPAAAEARPREVLVIEDNLDAGETLAEILRLQGHHVRVARDGRSGLHLARERPPEVVLCDIGLPDIDGYEVAREVRGDDALRATRLVALSGYAQSEDRQRARDAGFDAHIAKPPDIDELTAVLANVRGGPGRGEHAESPGASA
jgi:PAS domain S-box-containing protein